MIIPELTSQFSNFHVPQHKDSESRTPLWRVFRGTRNRTHTRLKYHHPNHEFVTMTLLATVITDIFSNRISKVGSRVGRNKTIVMWICDHWMQESTTDRRDRSDPPQCTTSREDRQIVRMVVTDHSVTSRTVTHHIESVTHHSVSARTIRHRLQQSGLSARRPLLGLPLTQNHRRLRRQWCNERRMIMRDHIWHSLIVQRFFVNHQIELLPLPARSPDLSPIENMWSMVTQRLTQITPPAATPDQLWQRVEAV
ncbi:transposable element Tcb1 transposase [Trichonephila clavipes]|nr:transposable element Tcb1 transposase [Trichonephila clavipes]